MKLLFTYLIFLPAFSFAQTSDFSYVPGKIYLKFKESISIPGSTKAVVDRLQELPYIQAVLADKSIKNAEKPFFASGYLKTQQVYVIELDQPELLDALITQLNKLSFVEYAEKIPVKRSLYTPNDPYYSLNNQYNLTAINAADAWTISRGNPDIIVGVIDLGVQTTHEDLAGNIVQGRDVADNDDDPNPPNTNYYHGSHVAGIVSAKADNGMGVASIGFNVKVMPIKAAKDGQRTSNITLTDTDITNGIYWAANHGVRVINMSLGGSSSSTPQQDAINYAVSRGCVVVAAAGNDNTSQKSYPAAYANVIAVASTTSNDTRSSFSNYGSWVDLSAPGTTILSTLPGNTYGSLSGTSMSSPLVAGLAALMLSVNPDLTASQVESGLKATADNIDGINAGYTGQLGVGRINAYKAVKWAQSVFSIQSGFWTSTDSWLYRLPSSVSNPVIQSGHTITVPAGNYTVKNTVTVNGTLSLSPSSVISIGR